jgi:ribonuclease Z
MRAAAAGSSAAALQAVFLTHLHSDHITDLNDVMTMRWATSFEPAPLPVVGPFGTADLVRATESMLEWDIGYRLAHHDDLTWCPSTQVREVEQGTVFERDGVRVRAEATDHAPVRPTVGFRIEDQGRSVVIAGDTVPCPGLDALCAGADVLVHTAVRRDLIEQIGLPRLSDVLDYHSSVPDVARTASRNGVSTIVLTHLVPAPAPGTEGEWVDQAAAHFEGEVVVAEDLVSVDLAL